VKKNEQYEIDITDLGTNGEGIGRVDGFTFFVEGALPGERVRMLAVKVKKNYGYGKLLEVLAPSPHRAVPVCPVFKRCGGCVLQHLSYDAQLNWKTKQVTDALTRIGGVENPPVSRCAGMENPLAYRNKAQFPLRTVGGRPVAGFFSARSHSLVPVDDCCIQHPANRDILQILQAFLAEFDIPCYDENSHTGLVRHVLTRCAFRTGEIMVCIVVNGKKLPYADILAARLNDALGGKLAGLVLNLNRARTNVILGAECQTLWGKPSVTDFINDLRFEISPLSFFQVNPVQTEMLYETALALSGVRPTDAVADIYCGIGTMSLLFAQKAQSVVGVELVPQAIADAAQNAAVNGITNTEFIVGYAEKVLPALAEERGEGFDIIVLDPPRRGCDPAVLDACAAIAPRTIVYVSCDPATLARDVKHLAEFGFTVRDVRPVDMFPQTPHVETVVCLSHKSSETSSPS